MSLARTLELQLILNCKLMTKTTNLFIIRVKYCKRIAIFEFSHDMLHEFYFDRRLPKSGNLHGTRVKKAILKKQIIATKLICCAKCQIFYPVFLFYFILCLNFFSVFGIGSFFKRINLVKFRSEKCFI
jgi:hypothetical protein